MTARTTPEGRGATTSSPRLYPPGPSAVPAHVLALAADAGESGARADRPGESGAPAHDAAVEAVADPGPEGEIAGPAESRVTLRALRRRRRHVMVGCALVIAVCVLLTALIVGVARDRRSASPVVTPASLSPTTVGPARPATDPARPTPDHTSNDDKNTSNDDKNNDNPDATASEGAQP